MRRLMVVTAHPDDEAASFGGTLRLYADRSVETCVVCLTAGTAAKHRGAAAKGEDLAQLRRREFMNACAVLHVTRPIILDYPDAGLVTTDLSKVVGDLCRHIRDFRPQVLLTYGAEGAVTGHPDHAMAGVFATLAFHWAGRADRYAEQLINGVQPHRTDKLYYATVNFNLPDRPATAQPPATATIEIGEHLQTKIEAFHAHTTQQPLFSYFMTNVANRGAAEQFHLAARTKFGKMQLETDLFRDVD
jgi:LmbE family N-acetylglucosaminyl deacetylase